MSETKFINGLFVKAPHQNAPEFVKYKLSVKVSDFCQEMKRMSEAGELNNGYLNAEILVSKKGEPYVRLDTWKPDASKVEKQQERNAHKEGLNFADQSNGDFDDAIPF